MKCQTCGSNRLTPANVDTPTFSLTDATLCLDCGTIQGEWPDPVPSPMPVIVMSPIVFTPPEPQPEPESIRYTISCELPDA
ncbi:MAG: hypothetical protein ABFC88_12385 [Thermoguttaceae bacterium]